MGSVNVWACALPDCNHYMPKHLENMLPGKNTLCWKCSNECELNGSNMEDDKPKCFDCSPVESKIGEYLSQHGLG